MSAARRAALVQAATRFALELAAILDAPDEDEPIAPRRPILADPKPNGAVDDVARQRARHLLKTRGFKVTS